MKNNSLDVLYKISNNDVLLDANLKYCLINKDKLPFTINGTIAKPNNVDDFFYLNDIISLDIFNVYQGLGISIQGSNICAIDVDNCFKNAFDITSIDSRGKDIIELFKNLAYIEFSFSGHGLRILFKCNVQENYNDLYYIKNSKTHIEFYYPKNSFRYVTITGKYLYNNSIIKPKIELESTLKNFLNKYMVKDYNYLKSKTNIKSTICKNISLKQLLLKDFKFQDVWFSNAPGSGSNESELDFFLIKSIYESITTDKDEIKNIFENSPYFKSKDNKHLKKWEYNNHRYYNYIYERL